MTLLAEVYGRVRIIPHIDIPYYPPDWHLHRGVERYMDGLPDHAREIDTPDPGDVALFRFGRCFSHGAIATGWPQLITPGTQAASYEAMRLSRCLPGVRSGFSRRLLILDPWK